MAYGKTNTGGGVNTSDATAAAGDIILNKTAYGSAGTKLTGTLVLPIPLAKIYICSNNPNINCGNVASGGTIIPYSINISNYIYTFAYGLGGNYQFMCLYFPIDSSAFPIRFNAPTSYGPFPAFTLISQYLDNGVVYINGQVGSSYYYDTFTIASKSFSTGNSGSHTSGTLINSALQLNGFQYDSVGQSTNSSGATLVDIRTKVTKL